MNAIARDMKIDIATVYVVNAGSVSPTGASAALKSEVAG